VEIENLNDFSQITSPYKNYSDVLDKSELVTYSFSDVGLKDATGKLITVSDELKNKLLVVQNDKNLMEKLSGYLFLNQPVLVSSDDLEELKCSSEKGMYCLYELPSRKLNFDSYYSVKLNLTPQFGFYDSTGKPIAVKPKTLYLDMPEGESSVGSKIKLTYRNHGDLRGIPQKKRYESNTEGTYTVVDEIVIPDGSELTDEQGNKFKVKVLDAERHLGVRNEYKGRYNHSLDAGSIRSLRPNLQGYHPSEQPAKKDIINEGKPSVIGGKILYDPTPGANTQ
jgi:hypothetical protein